MPSGVVLFTDRWQARRPLAEVVQAAVAGGVRWVVLREKDLSRAERADLAAGLRAILADAGGRLVVAGPDPLDGDAVHLPAAGPYPPPVAGLVGRSCHDAAELARLTTEDYVTLSPVYPTRTKPGYGPPLHPAGLRELIATSPVPVLALGGIETPEQVRECVAAGAAGVAVLGAIMRADDATEIAARLTAAHEAAHRATDLAGHETARPAPTPAAAVPTAVTPVATPPSLRAEVPTPPTATKGEEE